MQSKLARTVKTFTFRLALVYVGLFGLSVVILFAFIYTFAMGYVETQVSDVIRMRYNYILKEYHDNGSHGAEERIKELIANNDDGSEIYLLINRENEKMVGNLNEMPADAVRETTSEKAGNWIRFQIEGSHNSPKNIGVKALVIPLSKWRTLLVGKTTHSTERIEQTIVKTFWASLLVTLAMAFAGAIVMTRSVMHRINIINRSANTIMHGGLGTRIPFTEGGDEFDELSANLNQMLDKIETLMQSLGQFSSNIAHDLRSPLNRIINRLEAGLRTIDYENPARTLLEKNIQDMQEIINTFNSILKISELEANTEIREFSPCNVQLIIENLVEFYEPYAAEKEISLANHISFPIIINGEKNLLAQAFANLIDNAIKFTPKGGKVDIFCEQEEGTGATDIIIADNGIGVPADYMDKVFEKFFRLEQSRNTKGNGLGLSLVEAIASIHNATISLSDNHPGLRVRLRFPQV